jgi:hypothetical protein
MSSGFMIAPFMVLMLLGVPVSASMGLAALFDLELLELPLATFPRYLT